MRQFGIWGPVNSDDNYVVTRSELLADYLNRMKQGRYVVLFAPRQTGKTTFFQNAMDALEIEKEQYFPIQLNFEVYKNASTETFYKDFQKEIKREIGYVFQMREIDLSPELSDLLDKFEIIDHFTMQEFFEQLGHLLLPQRLVIVIDEFDGIPQAAARDFLHTLRRVYLLRNSNRCPYSLSIVGVKNITQLNYDRSISPFNIQDEFSLPNFSLTQVCELFQQYTDESGQQFSTEVIDILHQQTAGQPFLVNRMAQILTEELDIPKTDRIQIEHFLQAHARIINERNTNIDHLISNIRRDPRFEKMLMQIAFYDKSFEFSLHNETISELATYGILTKGEDRMCQIVNPIYFHCIIQALKPLINGLEDEYFSDDGPIGFTEYIGESGEINMQLLLENFYNFIIRVGYRILQVPDTPQEFVGQYLLYAYINEFVRTIRASMYLEVPTGRGIADLIVSHNGKKYIMETKVWRSERRYKAGKSQLAAYLKSEGETQGYYIVFDHRQHPNPLIETEEIDGCTIMSYIVPVVQAIPSQQLAEADIMNCFPI